MSSQKGASLTGPLKDWAKPILQPGWTNFLIHSNFLDGDLEIASKILPTASSDHKPISLVLVDDEKYGSLPFRFNPLWLHNEEVLELIKKVWSNKVEGSSSFILESKLKATKKALKQCDPDYFWHEMRAEM
jgi:hypothetical protein